VRNPQHSAIEPDNFDNGFDTDKLRSYGAARRHVMPEVEHWSHKGRQPGGETRISPGLQRFPSSSATPLIPLPGQQWSVG
jgi:transposase-like protein